MGTRTVDCYRKVRIVGEGTYGQVWKGEDRVTGRTVALKKIRLKEIRKQGQGMPVPALREIGLLKRLEHENIVEMIEIVTSAKTHIAGVKSSIYMVFEYFQHDLSGLVASKYEFTNKEVKCFVQQLLTGLNYLHENHICHRDVKCSNLLIGNNHKLKITDFGLARKLVTQKQMKSQRKPKFTNKVITLWYRPPELLLGATSYTFNVDLWSAGCVVLEILTGSPVFQGRNELDQAKKIFRICGFPDASKWPSFSELPLVETASKLNRTKMAKSIVEFLEQEKVEKEWHDLVSNLLNVNPEQRPTAKVCLSMQVLESKIVFHSLPEIALTKSLHEYEAKRNIRHAKALENAATLKKEETIKIEPNHQQQPQDQRKKYKYTPRLTQPRSNYTPKSEPHATEPELKRRRYEGRVKSERSQEPRPHAYERNRSIDNRNNRSRYDRAGFKVFVNNIRRGTPDVMIRHKCEEFGQVLDVNIFLSGTEGLIEFQNKSDADKAIEALDRSMMNGSKINVRHDRRQDMDRNDKDRDYRSRDRGDRKRDDFTRSRSREPYRYIGRVDTKANDNPRVTETKPIVSRSKSFHYHHPPRAMPPLLPPPSGVRAPQMKITHKPIEGLSSAGVSRYYTKPVDQPSFKYEAKPIVNATYLQHQKTTTIPPQPPAPALNSLPSISTASLRAMKYPSATPSTKAPIIQALRNQIVTLIKNNNQNDTTPAQVQPPSQPSNGESTPVEKQPNWEMEEGEISS